MRAPTWMVTLSMMRERRPMMAWFTVHLWRGHRAAGSALG